MAWAARRVDCPVDRHMPQLYSHLVLCAQVKINKTAWLPVQGEEEEEEHRAHADAAMWQPRGRIAGSHGSNGRLHQQPAASSRPEAYACVAPRGTPRGFSPALLHTPHAAHDNPRHAHTHTHPAPAPATLFSTCAAPTVLVPLEVLVRSGIEFLKIGLGKVLVSQIRPLKSTSFLKCRHIFLP